VSQIRKKMNELFINLTYSQWFNIWGTADDWNILSEAGVNGRRIPCTRGRLLGGSSAVNGTLCIRGTRRDFDDWNIPGWSGDDMFTYMAKAETFHNKPWFKAREDVHGSTGPIHTAPHDVAPISKLVLESYQEAGLPLCDDLFSTGETAMGCGHATRTIHDGLRTSAADFVAEREKWPNLKILCNTTVDKIIFDDHDPPRAVAVEALSQDGTSFTIRARKEIIISAGTYCSPAILLRSGIGPKQELENLGIPMIKNLPGVGENLLDHPVSLIRVLLGRFRLTLG
jgi:choline dehydrogenase-like flavoprotein